MITCPRQPLGLLFAMTLAFAAATVRGETPDYELDTGFDLHLPDGMRFGAVPGIVFNSRGELIIGHRGPRPIMIFDANDKLLRAFGDDFFTQIHGTRVDSQDNIWATDHKNHTVVKFSPEGNLLLALGIRNELGVDQTHFNRPTDVAFAPDGSFFVADGYGNNRVVKFAHDGTFLKAWGGAEKSQLPGEFHLPHCAVVDESQNLYIADRENDRIEVFDLNGTFLREFGGFAPFGVCLGDNETLFIADGRAHQVIHITRDGKELVRWGSEGKEPGQFDLPHGIAVDGKGAVYVTEINGKRVQRFLPRTSKQPL